MFASLPADIERLLDGSVARVSLGWRIPPLIGQDAKGGPLALSSGGSASSFRCRLSGRASSGALPAVLVASVSSLRSIDVRCRRLRVPPPLAPGGRSAPFEPGACGCLLRPRAAPLSSPECEPSLWRRGRGRCLRRRLALGAARRVSGDPRGITAAAPASWAPRPGGVGQWRRP